MYKCLHGLAPEYLTRACVQLGYTYTALITDSRTVQLFAQGVIVCVIVTARALVAVLCYLCVLKCLLIIIITITIICQRRTAVSEPDAALLPRRYSGRTPLPAAKRHRGSRWRASKGP